MSKASENSSSGLPKLTDVEFHGAGATVRHVNPFESLEVPRNSDGLGHEFIKKWVMPFYRPEFSDLPVDQEEDFLGIYHEINTDVVKQLLGDFNWRTKIVGAYFSALRDYVEFEDIIGNHLLKSEVCFAGRGYSLALANFRTAKSKAFLESYLDYYLTRVDLWFDQGTVLSALYYLDEDVGRRYEPLWDSFVAIKPNWDLASSRHNFSRSMETIKRIKKRALNHHE